MKQAAKEDIKKLFQFNREPNLAKRRKFVFHEINLDENEEWKMFDSEKLGNDEKQIKTEKVFGLKCYFQSVCIKTLFRLGMALDLCQFIESWLKGENEGKREKFKTKLVKFFLFYFKK